MGCRRKNCVPLRPLWWLLVANSHRENAENFRTPPCRRSAGEKITIHVVGRSGRPKVARSFFESVIGLHREVEKKVPVGLGFAALDALTNKQSGTRRSTRGPKTR